jgi:hypothetical protein
MGACSSRTEDELRQLQQQHLILLNQLTSNLANNSTNNSNAQGFHFPVHACQHCQHTHLTGINNSEPTNPNNSNKTNNNNNNNSNNNSNTSNNSTHGTCSNSLNLKTHDSIIFKIIAVDDSTGGETATLNTTGDIVQTTPKSKSANKKFMIQVDKGGEHNIDTATTPTSASTFIPTTEELVSSMRHSNAATAARRHHQSQHRKAAAIDYDNLQYDDTNIDEEENEMMYSNRKHVRDKSKLQGGETSPAHRKILKKKKSNLNMDEMMSKQNVYDSYFNNIDVFNNDNFYQKTATKVAAASSSTNSTGPAAKANAVLPLKCADNGGYVNADETPPPPSQQPKQKSKKFTKTKPSVKIFESSPHSNIEKQHKGDSVSFWSNPSKYEPLEEYPNELEALSENSTNDYELDRLTSKEYEYDYELLNDEFEDKTLYMYTRSLKMTQPTQNECKGGKKPIADKKYYEIAIDMEKLSTAEANLNVVSKATAALSSNPVLSSSLSSFELGPKSSAKSKKQHSIPSASHFSKSLNVIDKKLQRDTSGNLFENSTILVCLTVSIMLQSFNEKFPSFKNHFLDQEFLKCVRRVVLTRENCF